MIARVRSARRYLRQPIVMTRGGALGSLAVIGLAAGMALIIAVSGVRGLADERSARSAQARSALGRELDRERAARAAGDEANKRLAALERPTAASLARAIRRLRTVARHSPALRRELQRLSASTPLGPPTSSSTSPSSPPPSATLGPAAPSRPSSPSPSSPAPTGSSAPPPPRPRPRPAVDVPAPTVTPPAGPVGPISVPPVCPDALRPLLGIGCGP